jgi:hypothetical protein
MVSGLSPGLPELFLHALPAHGGGSRFLVMASVKALVSCNPTVFDDRFSGCSTAVPELYCRVSKQSVIFSVVDSAHAAGALAY